MTFRIKPPVIRRINKSKSHEAQEVLRRLRSFLDENSPKPVKILCNLWNDQQAAITYGELRTAILSGDLSEEMVEAWRQDYSRMVAAQFDKVWKDALAQGYTGQPSMDNLKNFRLDMTTPGVYNWIRQRGADFVTYSTREQKDAIKTLLTRSVTGKHSVDELARAIRPTIGLTQGQAQANVNYYEHMVKTMTEQHPLTSRNVILGRAREAQMRYAEKQHRQRAFTIAKTEQAFAFNKGADEGVRQAMARGFLPPMEKVWSTSWGGNVCPDCEALEGEVVGMDDAFFESRGLFRGDDLLPPLHPRCECAVQYREVEKSNVAGGLRDVKTYEESEAEGNSEKRPTDYPNTRVNYKNINSISYKNKIYNVAENESERKALLKCAKEILKHRSGTFYEDLAYIKNNRIRINKDFDYYKDGVSACKENKLMKRMRLLEEPYTIVGVHNHPKNHAPSVKDIISAHDKKYKYGVVLCHNETVFKYRVDADFWDKSLAQPRLEKLGKHVYNKDQEKINKYISQLSEIGIHLEVI